MGGNGGWKVRRAAVVQLIVQHAAGRVARGLVVEFLARAPPYFEGTGLMVEQPPARLPEA
jgi:hypothetical protein